jgi:methylphosphotriester-DNA--protein-cysteine methyltransferase
MMTLVIHDLRLAKPGLQNAALRDYDSVRRAIAFVSEHWRTQPTIEAMAAAAAVTPDELHHLFRRWAGLTPKGKQFGERVRVIDLPRAGHFLPLEQPEAVTRAVAEFVGAAQSRADRLREIERSRNVAL